MGVKPFDDPFIITGGPAVEASSFVMGLLIGWFAFKGDATQSWRLFLTIGILGGLTTFSTFSLDVALLYERGDFVSLGLYLGGSIVLSISAPTFGLWVMRSVT